VTTVLSAIVVLLVAASAIWWFAIRDSGIDTDSQIHGTWLWEKYSAYENYGEDGTWGVWLNADLVGDPHDVGTHTFDGETLTTYNAEDSYCSGAVATWTVEFPEDGQQARMTFVEDSCTAAGVVRGQDRVFVRQTP
jgi:hypothetical protein